MIIWSSLKPFRKFMSIYSLLQILRFTLYSIKLIEKLSRRHLINSFDVFVIKGFTVLRPTSSLESNHKYFVKGSVREK